MEQSCCSGLKLLSGIEQSVHFTIVGKTRAPVSVHLEECTTKHLVCWWKKPGGGKTLTTNTVEMKKKIHHLVNILYSVQDRQRRTAEGWEEILTVFDQASQTFIGDLSLGSMPKPCHHIHFCRQGLTFSIHFSLLIYFYHCWTCQTSVQLFGNIRRCCVLLTGVRNPHIAGQREEATQLWDVIYVIFHSIWVIASLVEPG